MSYQWREFEEREALYAEAAATIGAGLAGLFSDAPAVGLVAAGGTTAPPLLERLSALPLDWPRIWVTLTDERWVAPQDKASNEKMVRDKLLRGPAGAARFIPLYSDQPSPEAAEADCHNRLSDMPWRSSLCILGMGRDGHVASLFPGTTALHDALDAKCTRLCRAVYPLSTEIAGPYPRITLTLSALTRTRHIHLLITGNDKRQAFQRATRGDDEREMPVRAVLRQTLVPVTVYWAP